MEINMTNKDLKELLLQYNITNRDIKGSGKNGGVLKSDREREYLLLQALDKELVIIDDLLYQILLQTDIHDMENMCMINKNALKICYNQHFWIEKLNKDNISYNLPLPITLKDMIQFYKIKRATVIAYLIMNVYYVFGKYLYNPFIEMNNPDINQLYKLLNITLLTMDKAKLINRVGIMFSFHYGEWRIRLNSYKHKKIINHVNIEDLTTNDAIQYLAIIIANYPEVDIFTDHRKTTSYYDLIKT